MSLNARLELPPLRYKSKVVSNSLDKRDDHFTGFRVVKRFVGDILNARCLSYSRA